MKVYLLQPPFTSNAKKVKVFQLYEVVAGRFKGGRYWHLIWLSYAAGVIEDAGHRARLVNALAKECGAVSAVKNDTDAFERLASQDFLEEKLAVRQHIIYFL